MAEGWKVQRNMADGRYKADLLIQRPGKVFVAEVKAFSAGRSDRVLDGVPVCDAIQVWLDVSMHPSRGKEQADLIGS